MGTLYNVNANVNGSEGWGLAFSKETFSATLGAASATSFTVPGGGVTGLPTPGASNTYVAAFKYGSADTWVSLGSTAAIPAGATFAANDSELTPNARYVKAGDVISFLSTTGGVVGISIYKLQE